MPDADRYVPVIGLVGGVGSGKSVLARSLQKSHRVALVEGDVAGHEVLKETDVLTEIRRQFGPGVFDAQGQIDRRKMGGLVFGASPEKQAARQALEAIVHPRITQRLMRQIAAARQDRSLEAIVLDAALMIEAGWRSLCDHVIFVDVPYEQRLARVCETRGWTARQLQDREESQFSLERKRKEADDVVDNSAGVEDALSQLESIFSRITAPARPA